MSQSTKIDTIDLQGVGILGPKLNSNLPASELTEATLQIKEGVIADNGALCIKTGKFTGRSPKDRYIVEDDMTSGTVDWNTINQPITQEKYSYLKSLVVNHLNAKEELFVQDGKACADDNYRLNVRVIAEKPWSAQFAHNMFLRLESTEGFTPDWNILCAPGCFADGEMLELNGDNFVVVNFAEKTVIIGGTGYTGEIKKSIFSVLNYLLPTERGVLPMHCSANVGKAGETAIFFGLSGTGKTTLSTDPERELIGDDEHGWSDEGVFNFEGGCYAKCINLSEDKEPEIYQAIKSGAILENIGFEYGTSTPNYDDTSITQNTRVSYPIYHIDNIKEGSKGGHPKNVFFLTCDAFGVLPPVSRLSNEQAMYHFISGYTAKVAGTEAGIDEPQATFSACFGAPFLPLHPGVYAKMLGEKLAKHNTKIWLINTGWTAGSNPEGHRISLKYTRAIIKAILNSQLDTVDYGTSDIFGLQFPKTCPGVPSEMLNPKMTWKEGEAYDDKAFHLAQLFVQNFEQYKDGVTADILSAQPTLAASALST